MFLMLCWICFLGVIFLVIFLFFVLNWFGIGRLGYWLFDLVFNCWWLLVVVLFWIVVCIVCYYLKVKKRLVCGGWVNWMRRWYMSCGWMILLFLVLFYGGFSKLFVIRWLWFLFWVVLFGFFFGVVKVMDVWLN